MLAIVRKGDEMQAGQHANTAEASGQRCDYCGDRVMTVRRVALDQEYDRLQKIHREQYSCASCFEEKEASRLGLGRR
jgi:uncharacterized protein with PIN domain